MKESLLTTFFPVPKLLTRHAIGLDLSSESIKLVELSRKNNVVRLARFGEVPLPQGTIVNGKIENPEALKSVLVEAKKKFHLERVILSLPEEKSYAFGVSVPYVSGKELRGALELKLEEYVPLSPENIIFDYDVMRYRPAANEIDVHVAALPSEVVSAYIDVFKSAEIQVIRLYPEESAVARAVVPDGAAQTAMLIDFGHERTGISVVEGRHVLFNTILEFGAIDITRAIMKDFSLSYEEAERLKKEKGIREEGEKNFFPSALASLAVLKDELHKYYAYWNERANKEKSGKKIEYMYLSGGGAALHGLSEFLASYIDIPFTVANPWVNVLSVDKEVPSLSRNDSLRFATAIGLALTEYDSLNYD